jgi:hypothetical protein
MNWTMLYNEEVTEAEEEMRKLALELKRIVDKYGFDMAETYMFRREEDTSLNIRAKKNGNVVMDSFTFIR